MQKCFLNICLAGFPLIRWGTLFQINLPKLVEQNYLSFVWKKLLPEDWRIHFWCHGHAARTLTKDSNSHIYEHWNSTNTVQMYWFLDFGIMEAIFPEKRETGPRPACTLWWQMQGQADDNVGTVQREDKPEPDDQNWDKCCTEVIGQHTKHDSHDRWYGRNGELLWTNSEEARRKGHMHRCDEVELWCQQCQT